MELFANLVFGFSVALSWQNLSYCFIGMMVGTLVGVLPGIGPVGAIAMLMPLTFTIDPVGSIIMLSGIYYGSQYGGSTTSILVNLPGEPSSVITCVDGYQMAKQGRAGAALAIAAIGSFIAGTICTLFIALLAPPLATVAMKFGAPEYFSLMLMGLVAAAVLVHGDMLKSLGMIFLGLLFSMVGTDIESGWKRFTFDVTSLFDGIDFIVVAIGVFAISEIVSSMAEAERGNVISKLANLWPTREDMRRAIGPILRGTGLGAFFGILPGTGPAIASFSSYMLEKKISKHPEAFGHGAIEGVAGPESANNADAQCKFIPMLTLGLPASATMALMLGALMIHGITPGPQVMVTRPDLFWGLIASMWIGNLMLLVLNLPLVGLWVRLLSVPYRFLSPSIMVFVVIGIYSTKNDSIDIYLTALFGVLGVLWQVLDCNPVPLILGFVLGPMIEENLRRGLYLSHGDPTVFFTRPLSLAFIVITVLILIVVNLPTVRKHREDITE
jgi:putative tricarboxylic transport membrane protein